MIKQFDNGTLLYVGNSKNAVFSKAHNFDIVFNNRIVIQIYAIPENNNKGYRTFFMRKSQYIPAFVTALDNATTIGGYISDIIYNAFDNLKAKDLMTFGGAILLNNHEIITIKSLSNTSLSALSELIDNAVEEDINCR